MEIRPGSRDYPRYLLRLCELERIDQERRNIPSAVLGRHGFHRPKASTRLNFTAGNHSIRRWSSNWRAANGSRSDRTASSSDCIRNGKTHIDAALGLTACQKNQSRRVHRHAALVHGAHGSAR